MVCGCQPGSTGNHAGKSAARARLRLPVALLASVFATDAAMHHFRGTGLVDFNDPGTDFRLLMWKDGLRLIREHPWFGVGMNAVRDYWPLFNIAAYKKYALRSHF